MGIITEDMREIIESSKLSFAATVCADGSPSLSPKGSVRVYDGEHLIFMDIASPTTAENLRRDPRIEINSIDFIRRRGYRFKGTATLVSPGHPAYEWLRAWLLDLHGPAYPAHEAVLIRVERALPVLSPAYTFGDADEAGLAKTWAATYGVSAEPSDRG
ncbi:pyridoxamine 5'-phosphate oxidase family protein [Nonomuraea sp. B19D2]|uniref:pyridoxamine 5'-phosphate oxidase family protein n=1 Tax=Nonomuraea sp. B19D2 TaxID=3159561 RepID=UPI0032D9D48D